MSIFFNKVEYLLSYLIKLLFKSVKLSLPFLQIQAVFESPTVFHVKVKNIVFKLVNSCSYLHFCHTEHFLSLSFMYIITRVIVFVNWQNAQRCRRSFVQLAGVSGVVQVAQIFALSIENFAHNVYSAKAARGGRVRAVEQKKKAAGLLQRLPFPLYGQTVQGANLTSRRKPEAIGVWAPADVRVSADEIEQSFEFFDILRKRQGLQV